jgi:cellulose synthase/poly-beta-1,6-N-acetylglucosamine synthase-like glycosyltransferase
MTIMEYTVWIDWTGKDVWMTVLLITCFIAWLIQMTYFWAIFSRLGFYRQNKPDRKNMPVSIIIAAKNEYENLFRNLPLILEQDYPDFEVVVVDDASDDETGEYLKELSRMHPNLNAVTISSNLNFFRGKKFPLALGIKSAKNELLLLTDADCRPESKNWISEMQAQFDEQTQFVLGYGAYEGQKGALNKFIRWDTLTIAMQYFSFALAGIPYMGVGRNLAYRRSFFHEHKGFSSHYHISGGDDDLYVNKHANDKNTAICITPGSHTVSFPPQTFQEWIRQKRRHFTTGYYYKPRHKLLLGVWSFTQILFFSLSICFLITMYNIIPVCALLCLRLISQLIVIKKSMTRLQEKDLLLFSPIFELFFIIFNTVLIFSNFIKRDHKWK